MSSETAPERQGAAAPPPLPPSQATSSPQAEATARQRFACASCGGESTWNPSQGALVCLHCGSVADAQPVSSPRGAIPIAEHDLLAALGSIEASRLGWRATRTQVRCQSCTAISVFDPARVGQRCDFCGSTALVPYAEIQETFTPESLLPLAIPESRVRDLVRAWYRSRWFAPSSLATRAITDTVHALYVPYWTFDARVHAPWTALSGHYYYEDEAYRDAQGHLKTRRVQRIRWSPSAGAVDHAFDDQLVPATVGLHPALLQAIEPFPTQGLVPYDPRFLAGWTVERYQVNLPAAARQARDAMLAQVTSLCASQVPGDTHRDLQVFPQWTAQTFKHILVPVWILAYHHHGRPYQLLVNGVTGRIAGERPYSAWKIALLVLALLTAVGIVVLLDSSNGPMRPGGR